ncbi:hypothetical protein [Planctomyces sp. SH-PL14]|uniref:hypothetical protein n=1 Tax=Planctomyces sp. SH-PL14 TaxID=1632864 RepID=UPI00078C1F60|nr:hypothetical protein [Planctomyces sp. SH-PL14]AMV21089.1 hypothetical protein VT03_24510 [Planctomyces sp. SH-PL14]
MTISIPCPLCDRTVSLDERRMGRQVECPACRGRFLVVDEGSLSDGAYVLGSLPRDGGTSAANPHRPASSGSPGWTARGTAGGVGMGTGLVEEDAGGDESLGMLATVSMFLGGLSLAMVCIPAFAILTSVPGIVLGIVNLNTSQRARAITGILLNAFAFFAAVILYVQLLQDVELRM